MSENVWEAFAPFDAVPFTRQFLSACYERLQVDHANMKSFRNSETFLAYLQHGRRHYEQVRTAPLELQPLLLFYGMTQLVKACLLTVDPEYPRTSSVLAHGVSTRKKKRRGLAFADDEVRIQKHGLAGYAAVRLFHLEPQEGRKFAMRELLQRIPDLNDLHAELYGRRPFYPVVTGEEGKAKIPVRILDDLHMTLPRFIQFLQSSFHVHVHDVQQFGENIRLRLSRGGYLIPSTLNGVPHLPRDRAGFDGLPEIIVHYLLLYNLSMIGRYETAWWHELFRYADTNDPPMIASFLRLTAKKIPSRIARFLRGLT